MVSEKFWSTRVIYNKSGSFCNFPYSRLICYEANSNMLNSIVTIILLVFDRKRTFGQI